MLSLFKYSIGVPTTKNVYKNVYTFMYGNYMLTEEKIQDHGRLRSFHLSPGGSTKQWTKL